MVAKRYANVAQPAGVWYGGYCLKLLNSAFSIHFDLKYAGGDL